MAQTTATDALAITATPGRAKTSDKIIPMAAANARPRNGWRGAVGNFIKPLINEPEAESRSGILPRIFAGLEAASTFANSDAEVSQTSYFCECRTFLLI